MGFLRFLRAVEKRMDRLAFGNPPRKLHRKAPKGVKRGQAKEWRVIFVTEDDGKREWGTITAAKWTTAMTKARRIAKNSGRKDIYRIQVKLKRG